MSTSALAAAAGLVLIPFGAVNERVDEKNPWHGYMSDGPNLLTVRAQRVKLTSQASCEQWLTGLKNFPTGSPVTFTSSMDTSLNQGWSPWSSSDSLMVTDCNRFPCKVKLDANEVGKIYTASNGDRKFIYLGLVGSRISAYAKTEERKAFEFPGRRTDPWSFFEKHGLKSNLTKSKAIQMVGRKLTFPSDKLKPVRQVLDVRRAEGPLEATLWVRDIYNDHYFDGWGEWAHLECNAEKTELILVQGMFVELDLMKQTDLLSRMSRNRMRQAVEEFGRIFLDEMAVKLASHAALVSSHPSPGQPSGQPSTSAKSRPESPSK